MRATVPLGDINGDGIVDIRDYGIWRQNFGQTNCGNIANLTGNCSVDIRDYAIWRQHFGETAGVTLTPTPNATPTPTSMPSPTTTSAPAVTPNPAGKVHWSSGFYPGWQQASYPPGSIPWNAVTHLIHFSVMTSARRDGSINTTAHGLTPQFMQAAVAEAHKQGRKILLSIGGAEDNNWDAACGSTNRGTFINNLINMMKQYGYDGIDLDIEQDWQSPAHTDYIACVSGIRSALDQISPRPILTEDGDPDWQAYMLEKVWQHVDQINLMSYWTDVNGIATGLNNYTSRGIPRTLLGVGVGINDGGIDGTNPADCGAKSQYVVTNGYGGVMEWTVPADSVLHNGQTPCFNAIAPYVP